MSNFDLKAYMDITPEIEEAVRTGKPVVALESTILSHGMPYPENLSFAREVEKIIREQGAIPATMAIIDGRLKCRSDRGGTGSHVRSEGRAEGQPPRSADRCCAEADRRDDRCDHDDSGEHGGHSCLCDRRHRRRASSRRSDHGRQCGSAGAGAYAGCGRLRGREDDSGTGARLNIWRRWAFRSGLEHG